jgi:branched-chain amino acid transport system substrate-binding protein
MIEQAVKGTKTLEHKKIAEYLHKNEMATIVGPIRFDKFGERITPHLVQAQFRNIKDDDAEQFKNTGKQVVIWPAADKQGDPVTPFDKARKVG